MGDNQKTDPDLKSLGQSLEKFGGLYVLVRDMLAQHKVGSVDLAAWLVGEGRAAFVADFLEPLLARFAQTQRFRTINKTTIMVNLDADPILPFATARVVANAKGGWVKVQLRRDGKLYIDEKPLGFYLSEKQMSGSHRGSELKDELAAKVIPVLHPNIMDALVDHAPHLIPAALKADEQGNIRYTPWWGVVYENQGDQCVRNCYFSTSEGAWYRGCYWLAHRFDGQCPAAWAN